MVQFSERNSEAYAVVVDSSKHILARGPLRHLHYLNRAWQSEEIHNTADSTGNSPFV